MSKGTRTQFVNTAISFLGCKESDGSHRKIIDLYNTITPLPVNYKLSYNDPWCACYVSAVAWKCDMTDIVYPECSCDRMITLYKKAGRWQERDDYIPLPGDVVMYDWQDDGRVDNVGPTDHTGIVVLVNGNNMRIIEGNLSDGVGYRDLKVNGRYIRGYCLPMFDEAPNEVPKEKPVVEIPKEEKSTTVTLKQLSMGSTGAQVEAAQILLIGYGFRCGVDGHDGDFGPNTLKATKRYQDDRGLDPDGIIGPATWKSLLGVK